MTSARALQQQAEATPTPARSRRVYVFVVLTPVIIASGGPPAVAVVAGLLVWQVLWVLIAVAVLVETGRPALSRLPAR